MSGTRTRCNPGPLGPFVCGYRVWLMEHGYSPVAVVRPLTALGHLGRWIDRENPAIDQLTAASVSRFLDEYRREHGVALHVNSAEKSSHPSSAPVVRAAETAGSAGSRYRPRCARSETRDHPRAHQGGHSSTGTNGLVFDRP
jgi:hypothetical protein